MFAILRKLAVLCLLIVAGYGFWLTTLLFEPSNFRTEGSPAGAGLFVVLLGAPVVGLVALIAAVTLATVDWGIGRMQRDLGASRPLPAPRVRAAQWHAHPRGGRMGALLSGDHAILLHWPASGAQLWCSLRRDYQGRADAQLPFLSDAGTHLRLPASWTVPAAEAREALAHFIQLGERSERLLWEPLDIPQGQGEIWQRLS